MKTPLLLNKTDIARSFSEAAKTYDRHAFVQREVGQRLIERLDLIKCPPKTVLDIGSGTGILTEQLQQRFPQAHVFGLDIAKGMVEFAKTKQRRQWLKRQPTFLCADAFRLPFRSHSVDLLFSNLAFQWCFDLDALFLECKRLLKPNGMLFFSSLGPNTLQELRESFKAVDHHTHVNCFTDMHDYGDALLNGGLHSPVMDMEHITINYSRVENILADLKATGARNLNQSRTKGLFTPHQHKKLIRAYEGFALPNGLFPATFEVLYGHALVDNLALSKQQPDGTVHIPAHSIPVLNKKSPA